ncbi:MAG TPA: ribonuclease E/G [Stellaceae bacterium]|nr:ribonuclease E/G [Stellaceae bacterium]
MRRELLIAVGPGEWRAAWVEDGIPVELHVERGDIHPAGSVHLGRVVRLAASLDAVLVDIGEERPGFLPVRGDPPHEGARLLVQVRREAQRGKGARLSARIAEADRLAAGAAALGPPARLYPEPGFAGSLKQRLPGYPDRVLADDLAPLRELRQAFPDTEIAQSPIGDWPLDFDALFDSALAPTVPLPGVGAIHIDEGRAAVLIDVDTGSPETGSAERSARRANLAAARMIARQLRLRQLGGGIVIDFAALDAARERERVRQAVAAALADDPAQPQLLGWTRLSHLEIVRPRRFRSLSETMLAPPGRCKKAATLAFEALRRLAAEARVNPAANWRLMVIPAVEAALRGPAAAALGALELRLGRRIAIAPLAAGEPSRPDRDTQPFDIVAL